jgi:hypothetical protein
MSEIKEARRFVESTRANGGADSITIDGPRQSKIA